MIVLGTAAFAAWGMSLAGLLRAEAVLAVANGIFLFLLMFGGVVIPAASLPGPLATLAPWLPSGALVEALTTVLVDGTAALVDRRGDPARLGCRGHRPRCPNLPLVVGWEP